MSTPSAKTLLTLGSTHAGAPDPSAILTTSGIALVVAVLPNSYNAPVLNAAMAPTVPPNIFKNPLRA